MYRVGVESMIRIQFRSSRDESFPNLMIGKLGFGNLKSFLPNLKPTLSFLISVLNFFK